MRRSYLKPGLERIEKPDLKRIAWAAGIYEGEGCISLARHDKTRNWSTLTLTVAQKDPWILALLKYYFGGHINGNRRLPILTWKIHGARALGFMYTIFPLLSYRRREQFKEKIKGLF